MKASGSSPFGVRMPEELKNWLKQRAVRNRRSANSEILAMLESIRSSEKENAPLAATGEALVTQ